MLLNGEVTKLCCTNTVAWLLGCNMAQKLCNAFDCRHAMSCVYTFDVHPRKSSAYYTLRLHPETGSEWFEFLYAEVTTSSVWVEYLIGVFPRLCARCL